jgi:hypothetical protein
MFSLFRVFFLTFFFFYVVSPISYVKTDNDTSVAASADGSSTSFRLFVLEYIFNAHDDPDSEESSTTRILLRKAKRISSTDPKRGLFFAGYATDAFIPVIQPTVVRTAFVERNTLAVKPQKIFSSNYSSLSPPSV